MINQKYALKYSFPHSVVHIIDNSARTVEANVTTANDPSLLSTLVVTGAPMGEDNKIITLTRSDVAGTAFGLADLTPSDVRKYGQSVTYAMDLINQQVPVQFMRITPPDATYAAVSLVVQWRQDPTDNSLHVRFKVKDWAESIPRDNFKNTARLNEALIKGFYGTEEGWTQRAFINFIAAGRGAIYNNMAVTINPVSQAKRPANAKYQFITFDKRTSAPVERFVASLVNSSVGVTGAAITTDSVNTAVSNRVPGSSIVVPYVNEAAVEELYKKWITWFEEKINNGEASDDEIAMYNSMNINIFDMIFGKYIFNGSSTDVTLPFYVVDMETSDLPKLNPQNVISGLKTTETLRPELVQDRLIAGTIGISDVNSEAFIGDIFLSPSSSGSINRPKISIVTAVNQYTGMLTTLTMPAIYKLVKSGDNYVLPTSESDKKAADASRPIRMLTYKLKDNKSDDFKNAITTGTLLHMDIVAAVDRTDLTKFDLYAVKFPPKSETQPDVPTDNLSYAADNYELIPYTKDMFYNMFDREKHAGKTAGTGNAFGFDANASCYNRIGSAVIVGQGSATAIPDVYINSYGRGSVENEGETDNRIKVNRSTGMHVGSLPSEISHTNISGTNYDVALYQEAAIASWKATRVNVATAGTNYTVGDQLYATINPNSHVYTPLIEEPADWATTYMTYHTYNPAGKSEAEMYPLVPVSDPVPTFAPNIYYSEEDGDLNTIVEVTAVNSAGGIRGFKIIKNDSYLQTNLAISTALANTAISLTYVNPALAPAEQTAATAVIGEFSVTEGTPTQINRYVVSGSFNSLYAVLDTHTTVPKNYYSSDQGDNPSAVDGMSLAGGNAGFFDNAETNSIEYKWNYSALLVQALRGSENFDRRILSPTRVPAKFMFDAGFNTLIGSVMTGNIASYRPADIINASIIFTDEEKSEVILYPDHIDNIGVSVDIDVKQAMYDLMIQRVYDGIPEDKRPEGPGSGFQVLFDSGVTDADTTTLVRESFLKRFSNPNAAWDIGGFTERATGLSYTFVKHVVEDMFRHIQVAGLNKPYAGKTTAIPKERYSDFFPDIDTTDWGKRETIYTSGGNAWIMQRDGSLERRSQVTLYRENETSDLLQENNMRTLSRLIYLLQEKIDSYLLEYNSDSVLKTLSDEVNNMFSNWVGNYVDALDIRFERDQNIDGADILVCYVEVTFRGLILRVPIIVNVNSRA